MHLQTVWFYVTSKLDAIWWWADAFRPDSCIVHFPSLSPILTTEHYSRFLNWSQLRQLAVAPIRLFCLIANTHTLLRHCLPTPSDCWLDKPLNELLCVDSLQCSCSTYVDDSLCLAQGVALFLSLSAVPVCKFLSSTPQQLWFKQLYRFSGGLNVCVPAWPFRSCFTPNFMASDCTSEVLRWAKHTDTTKCWADATWSASFFASTAVTKWCCWVA